MTTNNLRITTNDDLFRIEREFISTRNGISTGGFWIPLLPIGKDGVLTFSTRQDAKDYLIREYGENILRNLVEIWTPC